MHTTPLSAGAALAWLRAGSLRLLREPARWLGMALAYLIVALLLTRVPFLGNFVLVLLTPIMLASALLVAQAEPAPAPVGLMGWLSALALDGLRDLFQVFRREGYAFTVAIVCVVTLGLVVLVSIPELLITGGSVVSGLVGAGLAGPLRPAGVAGIAAVAVLYVLLAMTLFYLVPLTLLGNRQPVSAAAESFRACVRQRKAVGLFVAPFVVVNLAIAVAFTRSHWLGYAVLVVLAMVSLPIFVVGLHASYRALFGAPARGAP